MSDEKAPWVRVKELFQAALDQPPAERARFLGERCGSDRKLLAEVWSLLMAHQQAGDFAERPALDALGAGAEMAAAGDAVLPESTLQPGLRLGPYQVVERIGRGGMGEVYRAHDTRLDRSVAIKVLPAHVAANADLKHRFEREARTLAALSHPHICPVFDVGKHGGVDYLVMEYIEGETLAARLARGALPLDQALRYAIEIVDALDKAHRKGIVHRDLKPGNVMLTKSGAKLLDFGLAKRLAAARLVGAAAVATVSESLTAKGTIVGTLHYMAPEQIEGNETDARSDLFSFGAVLYEMVSGARAFEAESPASVMAAVLERDPPSLSQFQPLVPAALEQLVERCLAKDPDDRWQTARDVHEQLRWITRSPQLTAVRASRSQPRATAAWLAAATVAAATAGAALWNFLRPEDAPERPVVSRLLITPPPDTPLARSPTGTIAGTVAISPDGSRIAYLALDRTRGQVTVYVRDLADLEARMIPGSQLSVATPQAGTGATPFFSPNGDSIAFRIREGVMRASLGGGPPVRILNDPPAFLGAEWTSDDTVLYSQGSGLYRVSAAGSGSPEQLTPDPAPGSFYVTPHTLPNRRALLFELLRGMPQTRSVALLDMETREHRVLVEQGGAASFVATGHIVFIRGTTLMAVPFDVDRLAVTGDAVAVLEGVSPGSWALSHNGTLAYVPDTVDAARPATLVWMNRAGRPVGSAVSQPVENPRNLRLSPDGKRVALISGGRAPSGGELWIHDLAGRPPLPLFQERANDFPVWSPDGKRVAFQSGDAGVLPVFWLPADGSSREPQRVDVGAAISTPTAWLSDDRLLLTSFVEGAEFDIRITSVADGDPRNVLATKDFERNARLSPNGRWLAFESNRSGQSEIWVMAFPSGAPVRVSQKGGSEPVWSRDGSELYYVQTGTLMAVSVKPDQKDFRFDSVELFRLPYLGDQGGLGTGGVYDVSPDGRFLTIQPTARADDDLTPSGSIVVVQNWDQELKRLVPVK
jgi:eukaryotic-like serine/threonine-protein kinase